MGFVEKDQVMLSAITLVLKTAAVASVRPIDPSM